MSLRPGDHDRSVPLLRQQLTRLDSSLPRSESDHYSEAMVVTVRQLQRDYGLEADGIVGPRTRRALASALSDLDNVVPDLSAMSALAGATVRTALQCLYRRVREVPLGSNRGPEVDVFLRWRGRDGYVRYVPDASMPDGWRGAPWCGAFAAWCAATAAAQLGERFELGSINDLMGCRKWQAAGEACGLTLAGPEPGCVGLIQRAGSLKHVVIVTRVGDGEFWSVEGNGAGDRVRAMRRPVSSLGACVRLR